MLWTWFQPPPNQLLEEWLKALLSQSKVSLGTLQYIEPKNSKEEPPQKIKVSYATVVLIKQIKWFGQIYHPEGGAHTYPPRLQDNGNTYRVLRYMRSHSEPVRDLLWLNHIAFWVWKTDTVRELVHVDGVENPFCELLQFGWGVLGFLKQPLIVWPQTLDLGLQRGFCILLLGRKIIFF